jgi:hypothetical protein
MGLCVNFGFANVLLIKSRIGGALFFTASLVPLFLSWRLQRGDLAQVARNAAANRGRFWQWFG